jgi:hypothetical protein
MSLDMTLDLACEPKRSLGYSIVETGTRVLLNLHKMELIAATIRQQATAEGRDLNNVRVRMEIVRSSTETESRDFTLAEMDAETAPLAPLAPHCTKCPASGGGKPFGCIRIVNYPITRTAEEWILGRLPMPNSLAGVLMLSAIRDFKYDGAIVRRYRSEKLFEASEGLTKPLPANEFQASELSTDAFFHAILGVGPTLAPWHLAMLLAWVDALRLDGFPLRSPAEFEALTQLPAAERQFRASVTLGDASPDEGVRSMQRMLFAMASAWMYDLPLRVDS